MDADAVVTLAVFCFGAYHLGRAAWRRVGGWLPAEVWDDEPCAAAEAPDYAAALADDPDAPLAAEEWLYGLNDCPDEVPHIAACGTSGSGKTTLVQAILSRRAGRFVVTTPKPASQDPWGGFPAVRLAFDPETAEPSYRAIGDAIEATYRELNWRGLRDEAGEPITLVVDELTTTIAELRREGRDVVPWLIAIWLRGRSAGIRLITMDPTINVKGWGIEGRGDVRENIAFIRCIRGSRRAFLGELEDVRGDVTDATELETSDVPALAAGSPDPSRVWVPTPRGAPAEPVARDLRHEQPTAATVTPYEAELVALWHQQGERSLRGLARRLYAQRGGRGEYDGSGGPFYAVKAALEGVTRETL